jgi:hypothetical protein
MATPTNQPLPSLSTQAAEHGFGPRAKQIGARLYATAWFATAGVSTGLSIFGAYATVDTYHFEVARYLVAARHEWTLKALPRTADPYTPGQGQPTYIKLNEDRDWFVSLERRKALGYSATAEEQAVIASWEKIHPFKPDTSAAYEEPAGIAAATVLATFGPILLLSLMRWIVTGRRGVGFRW